ncbi:MAG: RluA family pseudouridine synthase [Alphaproteobacteria bacterium]
MAGVQTLAVAADEAGLRLDRWFGRRFPALTHGRLQKLLRTGQVRVDGGRAKAGQRLDPGQKIRVPPLPADQAPARSPPCRSPAPVAARDAADLQARVLHRDDDVLVIDKPAGLAVQGGTGTGRHLDMMLDVLRFGAPERPRLVHRLDRDTSGCLVLARTASSAARMGRLFRGREMHKVYWALTVGVPQPLSGEINAPLAKDSGAGRERMAVDEGGDRAITRYAVVEAIGRKLAWVALMPITGRTHQLRAHMAAIGTPILGDGKYGGPDAFLPELPDAKRVHLHAREIRLPRPGGPLRVRALLPQHMRDTWQVFAFDEKNDGDPFGLVAGSE